MTGIKEWVIVILLFVLIGGSFGDIFHDFSEGVSTGHMLAELLVIAVSITLVVLLGWELWQQMRSNRRLKADLASARSAPPSASASLAAVRRQLAGELKRQFDEWKLTTSEREVGMLLLQGLSLKEIAVVRSTLEKTVRQQASSIYHKAGVSGRHAFAAWFIEDLL